MTCPIKSQTKTSRDACCRFVLLIALGLSPTLRAGDNTSDVFDINAGTEVTVAEDSIPISSESDVRDAAGGDFGIVETGRAIFSDTGTGALNSISFDVPGIQPIGGIVVNLERDEADPQHPELPLQREAESIELLGITGDKSTVLFKDMDLREDDPDIPGNDQYIGRFFALTVKATSFLTPVGAGFDRYQLNIIQRAFNGVRVIEVDALPVKNSEK